MTTDYKEYIKGKLSLLYGIPRSGKTAAMADRIKEDAEAGKRVCVIIPDQFTFEYEKMLCCHLGAKLYNSGNIDVLSFPRLTRRIFGETRFPEGGAADAAAKTAVIKRTLTALKKEGKLVYYDRHAERAGFVTTVMTMIGELIHSGVTPGILEEICAEAALLPDGNTAADKLRDLRLIYSGYSERLGELSLRDVMEDARIAAEYAEGRGLFTGAQIYMDEFKSFTGDQSRLIRAVFSDCDHMTVCMTTDNITGPPAGLFSAVNETCGELLRMAEEQGGDFSEKRFTGDGKRTGAYRSEALAHMARTLTSTGNAPFEGENDSITLIEAQDIYDECDYVCAEIKRLIKENPDLHYRDIAVLSRRMNEDIPTLSTHFERYGIPYFSGRKMTARHHPMLLALCLVTELAAGEKLSSELIFGYAKTGLSMLDDSETAYLEEFAFKWGVEGDVWEKDFSGEGSPGDVHAEELREKLLAPVFEFRQLCRGKAVTGTQICAGLKKFMEDTFMAAKLSEERFTVSVTDAGAAMQARENERIAAEAVRITDSLSAALPEEISAEEFRDIFILAAENTRLSNPPMRLDAVSAQQSDIARLSDPVAVFVMHANEGVFPDLRDTSETFSENERRLFKEADHELSGSMKKRAAEERVNAYKALCAPSERLYVIYSDRDAGGKKLRPSPLYERLRIIFKGSVSKTSDLPLTYLCRTKEAAFHALIRSDKERGGEYRGVRSVLESDPYYRKKLEFLELAARGINPAQEIPEGLVTELCGENLSLSQSSFEDYIKCPFMYLMKRMLRITSGSKQSFSALEWGNAVHECLREILSRYSGDIKAFAELTGEELERESGESIDRYLEKTFLSNFSALEGFGFFVSEMKKTVLRYLIHLREEMKESEFVPMGFEIPMGVQGYDFSYPSESAIIKDCGEHKINFTGKCDRADIWESPEGKKYIRIIDYKTGAKHDLTPELIKNGLNLQMILYYRGLTGGNDSIFGGAEFGGALYAGITEPEIIKARYTEYEDVLRQTDEALKMKGIVTDNEEVLRAMERPKEEGRRFIDEKGRITGEELEEITGEAEAQLEKMCNSVYSGSFPVSPLKVKSGDTPCKYCDYNKLCKNFGSIDVRRL